jgi:hypothetical protein
MGAAMMIAKGILGGIGGGLQGAGKGSRTVDINDMDTDHAEEFSDLSYQVGNQGMDKMKEKINAKMNSAMGQQAAKAGGENAGADSSTTDSSAAGDAASAGADAAQASEAAEVASAVSDVLLKTVYGDSLDDRIIDNFAKISAISFEYNDEAKSKYGEEKAVDDNQHIGVIAQELEANPITEGAVKTNENGDLEVDTRHLTFADTAAIAELSRRVLALEEIVKELQNKL